MAFRRRRREEPRPDLTPMIDVVFLLLIFFMISTTFIETPGLSIKLPESSAAAVDKQPEEVRVVLDRSGGITYRDESLTVAQLRARLAPLGEKAAETTFMLLADEKTYHGRVVELMDLARSLGFGKLAIATEPAKRP